MDAAVGRYRAMLVAVGMLALAVIAGAVLLWPRGEVNRPAVTGQEDPTRLVSATLTRVQQVPCKGADPGVPSSTCINVEARLADGKQVRFDTTDSTGNTFRASQQVRLSILDMSRLMGSTGTEFDMAFVGMMAAHHQGAIDMDNTELKDGSLPEVTRLAQQIIDTQQEEIDQLKRWKTEWSAAAIR